MQSKVPLLPSGPGGVPKSAFHGPWQNQRGKVKPKGREGSKQILVFVTTKKSPTVMSCLDSSFELQELGGTESPAFDFQLRPVGGRRS